MSGADPLAALWAWLASWLSRDGGVNGPVVHRADLKRMFAVHDTPWTQSAVISGLLHLYRRSGDDRWLGWAVRLGDAQCARQHADGHFRWAGHQDSRASLLVSNVLADCALLDLAEALDGEERHVAAAERNLREYVIAKLYRDELQGFAMAPVDYYAGRDRFILNMNSVAVEALVKLDRLRETDRHAGLVRTVGERILSLCDPNGLPYSDTEPQTHIPLYTGLAQRGLQFIPASEGVARDAIAFLERMEDPETRLWYHKLEGEKVTRYPLFVAGAGIICNGLLDAGADVDAHELAARLLRFQAPSGAIRNFVGYDHPDNGRRRGQGVDVWEDVFPTPNWNAQAFHFLCRVLPPPDPVARPRIRRRLARSRRYVYFESERVAAVVGMRPLNRGIAGLYVKRSRYGLVVPGPHAAAYWALRRL